MASHKNKIAQNKTNSKYQRPVIFGLVIFLFICIMSSFGLYEMYFKNEPKSPVNNAPRLEKKCLKLSKSKDCVVDLEVADSDATRIKGLSGRKSMAEKSGMLFVSDDIEIQCFWMRGMQFPLDMIWLDENKNINKIESNISPESYPKQFCSDIPDKYVIELNAGMAEKLGIKKGQALSF